MRGYFFDLVILSFAQFSGGFVSQFLEAEIIRLKLENGRKEEGISKLRVKKGFVYY